MFKNDFLRLSSYSNIQDIRAKFIALSGINEIKDVTKFEDSEFFITFSDTGDDVHKAMKYGVWTSTSQVNERL